MLDTNSDQHKKVCMGDVPHTAPCPKCGRRGEVYKTDTGYAVKCVWCRDMVEMEKRV